MVVLKTESLEQEAGGRGHGAWRAVVLAALLLAPCSVLLLAGDAAPSKEYQLKAAFLFNFAQFVDWPPEAFPEKQSPLTIGVLGDDPFKGFLQELLRDEKVGSRPLRVEYYRRVEDLPRGITNEGRSTNSALSIPQGKGCHILFISNSESKRLAQILGGLKGRSILTVGESDGFAVNGGMIRFITEQKRIRFRINSEAVKAANLTVSSKLLRLAEILPAK